MTWRLHVFTPVEGCRAPVLAPLRCCRPRMRSVTASGRRRWRRGCSAARGRCRRCRRRPVSRRSAAVAQRAGCPRPPTAGPRHRGGTGSPAGGFTSSAAQQRRPDGARSIRTVIRHRDQLPGPTVTVGVLAAVSAALAGHLRELGDDTSTLGAEVPMAKAGVRAGAQPLRQCRRRTVSGVGLRRANRSDRRGPGAAAPQGGAPGDARGEPGVRRGPRAAVALGRQAIRPDGPVADRHRQHRRVQCQPRTGRPEVR